MQKKSKWWTNGNGQGSEKWDAFEEAARFSNTQGEFDQKVKLQGNFMPSDHADQGAPTGHPMGFTAQIGQNSHAQLGGKTPQSLAQAQWWTQGNGQGTEKWDAWEEAARFSADQNDFEKKAAL